MSNIPDSYGAEISELLAHLSRITVPARPDADWLRIRELQRRIDGKGASLQIEHRHKAQLVKDRSWVETDIHGFERALVFVTGTEGDVTGTGASRLEHRLNARIVRVSELTGEIGDADARIRQINSEIVATQRALVFLLRRSIDDAEEKIQSAQLARQRRKATLRAMMELVDETPLWSPTAVMGYRVWLVEKSRLHGAWHRWESPDLVAVCENGSDVPHTDGRCADIGFGCGIYAAKDVTQLMDEVGVTIKSHIAVGLVGLEGKVVEHERGYRGQRATVLALTIVGRRTIRLVEDPRELATAFGTRLTSQPTTTNATLTLADTPSLRAAIATYLENQSQRSQTWTSVNPNE